MPKFERSSFMKFLSKPRYVRDVAEHFGMSAKLANYHLRKAVKSGEVLVSESPLPQMLPSSHSRRKTTRAFLYISGNSPLLAGNVLKPKKQKNGKKSRSNADVVSIKFLSKTQTLAKRKLLKDKKWGFLPRRESARLESKKGLVSRFLNSFVSKMRLSRRRVRKQQLGRERLSTRGKPKSLSHIKKLCLFQALSSQPLPFLDIHSRFGVSKRTVMGFVKRGLLEEEWGPRDIGVKFRLTEKGRSYLRTLEAASHFEHKNLKKIFIRLKQRISS